MIKLFPIDERVNEMAIKQRDHFLFFFLQKRLALTQHFVVISCGHFDLFQSGFIGDQIEESSLVDAFFRSSDGADHHF